MFGSVPCRSCESSHCPTVAAYRAADVVYEAFRCASALGVLEELRNLLQVKHPVFADGLLQHISAFLVETFERGGHALAWIEDALKSSNLSRCSWAECGIFFRDATKSRLKDVV